VKELAAFVLAIVALLPLHPGSQVPAVERFANGLDRPAAASFVQYRPAALPVKSGTAEFSSPAAAAYAIDATTGQVLYAKDETKHLPIASITKLVTVMTVLADHKLSDVVTVPKLPDYQPEDETMGLVEGEQFTLDQLIQACLVQSANDAADALALWDAGSKDAFTAKMNATAAKWGIGEVHFASPSGLQDTDNYASAESLADLAAVALTSPTITADAAMRTAIIKDKAGKSYSLTTTDQLLADSRFKGLKTGFTEAAGQCFVGYANIGGHDVITVILGSTDRFGDTTRLVNWISTNYTWL
jgi:serine-type D-Ala-D-Ala carboxypeptidase (penicillin-binding protein 5/6)